MRSIIEDIYELRKEKLMKLLKNIDPVTPVKFLSSCGSVELNLVRPAFSSAYSLAHHMQNFIEGVSQEEGSQ